MLSLTLFLFLCYIRQTHCRFHISVRLLGDWSHKTSKCGKNISNTLGYHRCFFVVMPHFDVICDQFLSTPGPPLISDLAMWRETRYNLRGHKKATVPRFSTQFMKHSIRFRGAVLWNFVSDYLTDSQNFKQFIRKVKLDPSFREINFNILSVQSVPKKMCDFIF